MFAVGVADSTVTAGDTVRGTAGIFAPAPAGGAAVKLKSSNPSVVQVPAKVRIAEGNSANSFTITTSPVPIETSVRIDATLGGVTKSVFLNVSPNPDDPPLLESLTITPSSVPGGTNATGTVTLSGPAPAGGIFITLSSGNNSVAQVPPIVAVAGGQTSANFTVTTVPGLEHDRRHHYRFLGQRRRNRRPHRDEALGALTIPAEPGNYFNDRASLRQAVDHIRMR